MDHFTLGFVDGLTVGSAVAAGMSVTNNKHIILLAIIGDAIAGSISMGLSEYLSLDQTNINENPVSAGLTVGFGYLFGSLISFFSYYLTTSVFNGFRLSIFNSIVSLIIFGYIRGKSLNLNILNSIKKSLIIGLIAIFSTFSILRLIK